jgi:hypothetical protein
METMACDIHSGPGRTPCSTACGAVLSSAALLALLACAAQPQVAQDRLTTASAVAAVIDAAPHGLSARSGIDPAALEVLEADPSAAASEIARRGDRSAIFTAPTAPGREPVLALERSIQLLAHLASVPGDAVLSSWYIESLARRKATDPGTAAIFARLMYEILTALDTRHAGPVVLSILDRWPEMSVIERRLSLAYVARASRGRADVAYRLRSMLGSGAADQELLARALDHVEGR